MGPGRWIKGSLIIKTMAGRWEGKSGTYAIGEDERVFFSDNNNGGWVEIC